MFDTGFPVIMICIVESNFLIPGPEMTDMASLIDFDGLCLECF